MFWTTILIKWVVPLAAILLVLFALGFIRVMSAIQGWNDDDEDDSADEEEFRGELMKATPPDMEEIENSKPLF